MNFVSLILHMLTHHYVWYHRFHVLWNLWHFSSCNFDPFRYIFSSSIRNAGHAFPKTKKPYFDGYIIHWHSFRDTFTSLANPNPNIDDVTWIHYICFLCSNFESLVVLGQILLHDKEGTQKTNMKKTCASHNRCFNRLV